MSMEIKNDGKLSGVIMEDLVFSHDIHGEKIYQTCLRVVRLSGKVDDITLMISDRLPIGTSVKTDRVEIGKGTIVEVTGSLRSHNVRENTKDHIQVTFWAATMMVLEEVKVPAENEIKLNGILARDVTMRETSINHDFISDLLMTIPRKYGKSDFVCVICWQKDAVFAAALKKGTRLMISGRVQSRSFMRQTKQVTILEVSANQIEVYKEEGQKVNDSLADLSEKLNQ